MKRDLEARMNLLLERLGIPLRAVWSPDADCNQHAKIDLDHGLIIIFDEEPSQAWISFMHEAIEFRLRPVLKVYRDLVNHLISIIEKSLMKGRKRR